MAGYWIVKAGPIRDAEAQQAYVRLFNLVAQRYKAELIAGKGRIETVEGTDFPRQFLIRFDSFETAQAAYRDPDYQASLPFAARMSDRELSIVEGVV
ncbi:DUF1330 domain-containing protein [Tabrizicola oligotrophica]|uniref:DUF1330 domain-containing protein n=1 Tax=Tabrizicola oligotrophica TaxID=2710650 RepID=A0A6M0QVR8_9RHOB|nr:DUF1330 domain-containing protein [Tabrizicola oligotrophica]NEY91520.1 DUF1330 domain-containing protein [Tabrizicola oligotrophica]